jgi:hypothetical protein
MKAINELVDRYISVWNEPDVERRRVMIKELWSRDATQLLQPPMDIKASAAAIGMTPILEIRGHDALEHRVTTAYERFVAPGEFYFRPGANPDRLRAMVKMHWEMVRKSDGEIMAAGLNLLFVDDEDRVVTDYQFVER